MVKKANPLVTVAVVTYNSSRFILETLDSIKAQTYQNIELIISDDCSKDNTVEVCQKWINDNGSRFVNTIVITTPQNTGTAGNANRAFKAANGEWMKYIAGDDIMMSDAIDNYIKYVYENNIQVCFAEAIHFTGDLSEEKFTYEKIDIENAAFGKKVTVKKQFDILKRQFIGSGPTFFVQKAILEEVGGFDERFPLMDDYPLFIKIAKAGYRFYIMPSVVLYKRNHAESVSHQKADDAILTKTVIKCIKDYKYLYKYEQLNTIWKLFLKYSMTLNKIIIDNGNSKKNIFCKIILVIISITDPFIWYSRYLNIKDKLLKE